MKRKLLKAINRLVVPSCGRKGPASRKVAIIIPMSTRADLTAEEEISMRQLRHYFGAYDKFLIAPEGLEYDFDHEGFEVRWFPRRFFGSAAAHGRMLNAPAFYKVFEEYEFIFFHHLDSLAFSDQLPEWCDSGVDYIGPPWINCPDSPWVDRPRVGNGGFTLLRVDKALRVFERRYEMKPGAFWLDLFTQNATRGWVEFVEKIDRVPGLSKVTGRLLREWRETEDPSPNNRNNDVFWSDMAVRYLPDFKVASLEEGLRFAFETSPRVCLEMNGGKMPFGCHAWARYDRAFWEPFLVKENVTPADEVYFEALVKSA